MQQTPRSAPTPDPTTARHRPHTAADAARPPPRTDSTPPTRRGTDPGLRRRSSRTRSPWPAAAAPEASRAGRAAARTADADWRRPAPRPIGPPPPARRSHQAPTRSGIPTAPSFRSRPRPAAPASGSHRAGSPRPGHPAARIRLPDLADAHEVRGNRPLPSSEISLLCPGDNRDGVRDGARGARVHVIERRVVRVNGASAGGDRRHRPAIERRRFGCAHAGLPSFEVWSAPQGNPTPLRAPRARRQRGGQPDCRRARRGRLSRLSRARRRARARPRRCSARGGRTARGRRGNPRRSRGRACVARRSRPRDARSALSR